MRKKGSGIAWLIALMIASMATPLPLFAQLSTPPAPTATPQPAAPPRFPVLEFPKQSFKCERYFLYRGKTLECDSKLSRDGDNLRPILGQVPSALSELDTYQANRTKVETLAYTGTIGILTVIAGLIIFGQSEKTASDMELRNILVISGGAVTLGSIAFGVGYLSANERHLDEAVRKYNEARPSDPIELQFSTRFSF